MQHESSLCTRQLRKSLATFNGFNGRRRRVRLEDPLHLHYDPGRASQLHRMVSIIARDRCDWHLQSERAKRVKRRRTVAEWQSYNIPTDRRELVWLVLPELTFIELSAIVGRRADPMIFLHTQTNASDSPYVRSSLGSALLAAPSRGLGCGYQLRRA